MTASLVGWRAACAEWGEPARPGLPRRGNGKGEIRFLAAGSLIRAAQGHDAVYAVAATDFGLSLAGLGDRRGLQQT
jgi:hypothetical protein